MSRRIEPWQVWWVDFDPVDGREQGKTRPAVVVSSPFHLRLVREELLTVVPLTTVERPWPHRVEVEVEGRSRGWAITEQIRTVSASRLSGSRPMGTLPSSTAAELGSVLSRMLVASCIE
jgi:mRNA interferase MazF